MLPRVQKIVALLLMCASIAIGQDLVLEPQWCFIIEKQPFCLTAGDLNNDGMSEIIAGLYSREIVAVSSQGRKLWQTKVPEVPDFIRVHDLNGDGQPEIVVACFPHLLFLDSQGRVYHRIKFPAKSGRFSAFEIAKSSSTPPMLFLLTQDAAYLISSSGKITAKIGMHPIPYKGMARDLDNDGKLEFIALSEFELACYAENGDKIWRYEYPLPPHYQKEKILKQIEATLNESTIREMPKECDQAIKNYRKDLEPIDISDLNGDGQPEIVASFLGKNENDKNIYTVVCLSAVDGNVLWTQSAPNPILSIKIADSLVYVCGGYRREEKMSGYLMRLSARGAIQNTRSYRWPAYFLRRIGDFIALCEYESVFRCHVDASDDGIILRDIYVFLTPYTFETCDLNGDGYTDVVSAVTSLNLLCQFRIDAFLNNVPLLRKKADDAWMKYKDLSLQGESRAAQHAREKAERYDKMIGKTSEAFAVAKKIDHEVSSYHRRMLLVKLFWSGVVLLPLIVVGYIYKRQLAHFFRGKYFAYSEERKPPVELLRSINSFIHESRKKILMLNSVLNQIDDGKPLAEVAGFFNSNLQALKTTFVDFQEPLAEYEALKGRAPKELKKMLDGVSALTESMSEAEGKILRSKIGLLAKRIDTDMREEIMAYRHSLADAVRESADIIQKEKLHDLERYSIRIQTHIQEVNYPREIYYNDFEQWKIVITNLLRNAVEATVKAVEDGDIPPERRLILLKLAELHGNGIKWAIEIEDHGCGMDDEVRANMFRSGFTYGKKGGSGQGLTSELELFVLENGNYVVQSAKGVGTKISLEVGKP